MGAAWAFSIIMAALPLFGVSDYRKFAVCLPFETEDAISKGYVIFLMVINGVAFFILMGCYLKMYCAIRGSQAWNSNDSKIAKRMALLVFTDFICWFPIAFFAVTAACGVQLISLEGAKVGSNYTFTLLHRQHRLFLHILLLFAGVHGLCTAPEQLLQPLPVRHPDQTVQEGLCDDLQDDRGESRDPGHRPVQTQQQLQQPPDPRQHQQPQQRQWEWLSHQELHSLQLQREESEEDDAQVAAGQDENITLRLQRRG